MPGGRLIDRYIDIFMPAYNASQHIRSVLDRIPGTIWDTIGSVYIINDGSTDTTRECIEQLSKEKPQVRPVHFEYNRGYGCAVERGLLLCKEGPCRMAVCLHADGQYAPECIPQFERKITTDGFDLVQGSRIAPHTALAGGMPMYKFAANRALTFFENIVFGMHMTDYHSGYLCYGRKALDTIPFESLSSSFDFDLEVIACARASGLKIGEISIPTRYADEISHLNPLAYGFRVLGVMGRYLLGRYKNLISQPRSEPHIRN
ncbi:MAG: glycosyltransferase [Chitinivibrionales bacterium]|nr:glycosyltransferase [Chitinivibrionales bacterium]